MTGEFDSSRSVCAACGDALGAYEPLWLERADGDFLLTGLISSGEQARAGDQLYHRACISPPLERIVLMPPG